VFTDLLGSVRALTGEKPQGGSASVIECYDYEPFGRMLADSSRTSGCYPSNPGQGTSTIAQKFTGKERDAETGLDFFGTRYFSGAQGRFTSADPYNLPFELSKARDDNERAQLRDRHISNPQVWNKYAYTLNNPLRYVDPKGECSKPTKMDENDTGICIEAFIAGKWVPGTIGRGDDRGFSGTDSSLTARSRLKLVISPDGKVKSQDVESSRSGVLIKGLGLEGTTIGEVNQNILNKDGSRTINVILIGVNGEAGLPFAPKGAIQGNLNFTISSSGSVSLNTDGRSAVTGYPSWGIYSYEPNAPQPKVLLEMKETNIQSLQHQSVPIPRVKP
jgi:RHS repeat-associated protein